MANTCRACRHPDREALDRELVVGTPIRVVAGRRALSVAATHRHAVNCLPKALSPAAAGQEAIRARGLQDRIDTYIGDLQRIRRKAERRGEYSVAISAIRELTRLAELEARAQGHLRAPSSNGPSTLVQVNTGSPANDADWATTVRHARMIVEMADEEARDAATQALPAAPEVKP